MYDFAIIGGGISGLYINYKLIHKTNNTILLEGSNRFGGRIYQYEENFKGTNISIPAGAARFNKNHKRVIKLLREFNLIDFRKDKGIGSSIDFIDSKNEFDQRFINKNGFEYIRKVLKSVNDINNENLNNFTFKEYAKMHLNSDELEFMLKASGYSGQLKNMNMYDAYNLFKTGIRDDITFYAGYFHLLINELVRFLKNKKCNLKINSLVKNIIYSDIEKCYTLKYNNSIIKSKNIILCLPKPNLLKLNILKPIFPILKDSIECKPLCRIYAKFKDVWFKDIKKTVTNNPLRYIIPIDKKYGIIMISYTDDIYTNYWSKIENNQKILKNTIKRLVKQTFNINIEEPEKVWVFNWECGVGYWKKNINSYNVANYLSNPFSNLYIAGENYSLNQSWVEGAIESCDRVLKKI